MLRFKINNIEYEAPEGATIFDVADNAGIHIPTLCFKKGLPHYSSCMVCMVKDKRNNSFIPSCSALVQAGMDIDASGAEVTDLRKKAIELLLSEHRAECEAPCRIVCPAGYNIPLMNRLLGKEDLTNAEKLSLSQLNTPDLWCLHCPGYCENACRRKKIDVPVSIKNLQMYISGKTDPGKKPFNADIVSDQVQKPVKDKKRFSSQIGKMEPDELKEWLKECISNLPRHREIDELASASAESLSCMHCDCRAADDCKLRDLADGFSVKNPGGKLVNSPIEKKININTGLVFENAKCIKCGLCVRLCEDSNDEPALCFIHRGFVSIISEPLTEGFDNVLKTKSQAVIDICPTGALSKFK